MKQKGELLTLGLLLSLADFEKVTGEELSKKYLPETLANEIARKKKKLTK